MKERGINPKLNQEYFLTSSDFTDPISKTATNVLQNLGYSIQIEELFMRDGTPIGKGLVVYADKEAGEAYSTLVGNADFSVTARVMTGNVVESSEIEALELLNDDERSFLSRVNLENYVSVLQQQAKEQYLQAEATRELSVTIMNHLQENIRWNNVAGLLSHPEFMRYNSTYMEALRLLLESQTTLSQLEKIEVKLKELGDDNSVDREEMMGKIVGTILSSY